MTSKTLIRHYLSCNGDDIVTPNGEDFDLGQYGRMKYGSLKDCRNMGFELGRYILNKEPRFVLGSQKICSPFMYKHVPSAALFVARYAFSVLNAARAAKGLDRIHIRQIYINKQPDADYSKLDQNARRLYMEESGLELITQPLDGYNVLTLDDIRITGNYIGIVKNLVSHYDIGTILHTYWAAIAPDEAAKTPAIENRINSSAGTGLDFLRDIIESGQFVPTLRSLKLLLSQTDQKELKEFLSRLPRELLFELYEGAVGTGYDLRVMYSDNYMLLQQMAERSYANDYKGVYEK